MRSIITDRYVPCFLILLIFYSVLVNYVSWPHFSSSILRTVAKLYCYEWEPLHHQLFTTYPCPNQTQINTVIWTHDGSGLMKYIQWIIIRKLGNLKITQLDDDCCITKERNFSSDLTIKTFVQIYIISLSADLTNRSRCSRKINETANTHVGHINHIYFKRKSFTAITVFQQIDLMRYQHDLNFTFGVSSFRKKTEKAMKTIRHFPNYFTSIPSIKWKVIHSEDLIHSKLTDCERSLTDFLSLLGYDTSTNKLKQIIKYDSHRFIEDATWWDQSEVAERVVTKSIPSRPSSLTYSNDFYHLHGNRSFVQYLSDNRQCYNDGTFAQMHSERTPNRISTDKPNRCLSQSFDCAFSDIYSFSDREQLYEQGNEKPIKCGFAIPSIFDKVRQRYGRNQTCETIIFTSITNCYDPLPGTQSSIPPSFCFVALLDTRTFKSLRQRSQTSSIRWDLIDLGPNASLFSFAAKTIETLKTLGQRMFPLAKWIVWLDGKAYLMNIPNILIEAQASAFAARHTEVDRTSAIEVNYTIERIRYREQSFTENFNKSVMDIKRQEKEYQRDGFYSRSNALNLRMYDIALFLYRNNHPCTFRYLCGWHNEINYFSYRGQLSVYYSAVRLNITDHLYYLPRKYYHTYAHTTVC